jgi:hypothetical protein
MDTHIQLIEKYINNFNQLYVNEDGSKHLIFAGLANICDINDEIIHVSHLTLKQQHLYKKPFIMTSLKIDDLDNEEMTEENKKQIKLYKAIKIRNKIRKCMLIYHTLCINNDLNREACVNCLSIKVYPSLYVNWKHA